MAFSRAAVMFRVGDKVTATAPTLFGDEYKEGDKGIVVDIREGGLVIAREHGGIIRAKNGNPFICDANNWE